MKGLWFINSTTTRSYLGIVKGNKKKKIIDLMHHQMGTLNKTQPQCFVTRRCMLGSANKQHNG